MPKFNELLAGQEVELQKRDPKLLKRDKRSNENYILRISQKAPNKKQFTAFCSRNNNVVACYTPITCRRRWCGCRCLLRVQIV